MDAAEKEDDQRLPCMKYNRYQDRQEAHCSDPQLYCKYRTSCLIDFMEKNNARQTEKK